MGVSVGVVGWIVVGESVSVQVRLREVGWGLGMVEGVGGVDVWGVFHWLKMDASSAGRGSGAIWAGAVEAVAR